MNRQRFWLSVIFILLLGAAAGYFLADQRAADRIKALDEEVSMLQRVADVNQPLSFMDDQTYRNSRLGYSMAVPAPWQGNSYAQIGEYFDMIFYKARASQPAWGSQYAPILIIYRCTAAEFGAGGDEASAKCPGDVIKQNRDYVYTWKEIEQIVFPDQIKVVGQFREGILPTFQIEE